MTLWTLTLPDGRREQACLGRTDDKPCIQVALEHRVEELGAEAAKKIEVGLTDDDGACCVCFAEAGAA